MLLAFPPNKRCFCVTKTLLAQETNHIFAISQKGDISIWQDLKKAR